ncbi:MAG: hypothetical protein AAF680_10750 [Pseudomonadota bacterium]
MYGLPEVFQAKSDPRGLPRWLASAFDLPRVWWSLIELRSQIQASEAYRQKQWEKVRVLAENGFWFRSVGDADYPETLSDVPEFLEKYAHAIRPGDPELWEKVIEYCARKT